MADTNHGSIEFLKFPNPQFPGDRTKLIKKWLRDSWARRKIIALQQAVSSIVVPTKTSDLTNDSGFITSAPVTSVNTKTGAVTLDASDVGALPSSTVIPTKTSDLTNDSGYITSVPVQSVNGQTGAVSLDATDVGALPDTTVIPTVPTNVSAFNNDAGYLTSAPVTSVNNKTGVVNLNASDVGALPSGTAIPSKTSDLTNDSGYITASALPSVPSASTASPKMDGTASAGSSTTWSRGDHVHPHDTSKADKATTLAGYGITDAYTKTQVDGMIPTVPTNVSAFTNDAGYITAGIFSPTTYIQPTPYSSRCTISAGGYIKIGRIVFLDVTIESAQASSTTSAFVFTDENSDLVPLSGGKVALSVYNETVKNTSTKAYVSELGKIVITNCATGQTLHISGCYISA